MSKQQSRILVYQVGVVALILIPWECIGRASVFWKFLIGTPTAVLYELWDLLAHHQLWKHFLVTGSEAVIGLLLGTAVGSIGGLLLWYSDTVARVARPFILILGSLPVFAFAPLMIVWFGVGFGMKVALAAFSTVFIACNQGYRGATLVASDYVDTLRGMNASRWQIFKKVIIPGSINWVLASARLNVGFGLLGAFIGEFIASNGQGLGYLIIKAGALYNVPRALAACVGLTVLALVLDWIARFVEHKRHVMVQILSVPRVLWTWW